MEHKLIDEDFSSFSLGPFPYDPEHSAMGEYHYYPEKGYKGIWHDPIADWNYDGPSWIITDPELNGHAIETRGDEKNVDHHPIVPRFPPPVHEFEKILLEILALEFETGMHPLS